MAFVQFWNIHFLINWHLSVFFRLDKIVRSMKILYILRSIYISGCTHHHQELMKLGGNYGSLSLVFMIKVMVWNFVSYTQKVMTISIVALLVLVLLELTECTFTVLLRLLCNLLDIHLLLMGYIIACKPVDWNELKGHMLLFLSGWHTALISLLAFRI